MQVRLITTVETIIEIDPESTDDFETAKREIFNRLKKCAEEEDVAEEVKSAHSDSVVFDSICTQSVTHSFEEVK